jgi:hypothetical protein
MFKGEIPYMVYVPQRLVLYQLLLDGLIKILDQSRLQACNVVLGGGGQLHNFLKGVSYLICATTSQRGESKNTE